MEPELTPTGKRWYGQLTWMDSGGGEHSWGQWHTDHTLLVSAMAGYFELVAALAEVLDEDTELITRLGPGDAPVVRHVWRAVITYQDSHGTHHTRRELTGDATWVAVTAAHAQLVDLRETFRQVYGYHPPRPLGDDFTEGLDRLDNRPTPGQDRLGEALKRLGLDPE